WTSERERRPRELRELAGGAPRGRSACGRSRPRCRDPKSAGVRRRSLRRGVRIGQRFRLLPRGDRAAARAIGWGAETAGRTQPLRLAGTSTTDAGIRGACVGDGGIKREGPRAGKGARAGRQLTVYGQSNGRGGQARS